MKKILFIFFIWFSFHICVSAQEQDMPPQLSIGQMYEDFDEFAEIVSDVNPQLKIRYKITGYNQLDTLKKLRGKIGGISNYYDFIRLMSQATRHMHDIHCYMLPRPMPLAGIGYCDTAAIRQIREGYTKYFSEENSLDYFFANNIPVPMVNINGEYYTSGTWQILDRELSEQGFCDQEPFVSKARIINYYGKSYQTYVEENLLSLGTPRWDFDSSRFFHHSSYLKRGGILEIINHDEKHMFVNTQVNDSLCIVVASASIDEFKSKSMRSSISLPSLGAVYLDSLNVLYIFMEQMQDKDNVLINEIKKASANKTVNKIVIDVRENRGGGDGVWHSVLKYIIKDTLDVKVSAAYKKSKYMEKYADERTKSEMKSKKISQLDDEEYWVTDGGLTFIPDAEGLHYDGKIYILQDRETYSSAHALTSMAGYCEQLVSAGEPTGLLAGMGASPWVFQLKHSKFTFTLEPVLDISNVKELEDFYHDTPEIIIKQSVEDVFKRMDDIFLNRDIHSKEYLLNHDPVFKKVLELE